ncbi:hypothetical protein R1flu_027935 [Riccia fluitans]|uniref:Uncharacterized protein n=1 Tax=Riccia fluitans TaxID=41844 RepID=A0ABD1XKA0_9MARC
MKGVLIASRIDLLLAIENDELHQEQNTNTKLGIVNELRQEMDVKSPCGNEDAGSLSGDPPEDEQEGMPIMPPLEIFVQLGNEPVKLRNCIPIANGAPLGHSRVEVFQEKAQLPLPTATK